MLKIEEYDPFEITLNQPRETHSALKSKVAITLHWLGAALMKKIQKLNSKALLRLPSE